MDEEVFVFEPFRLNPAQRTLFETGRALRFGSRAFDILVAPVERAGETISKEELIVRAWPGTVVEEAPSGSMVRRCAKRSAMVVPASAVTPNIFAPCSCPLKARR